MGRTEELFYSMVEIINENLEDTIDPVRESIAEFILTNYKNKTLPYQKELLRMIVKCKFYKNYPIVRNEDWIHDYVYGYLKALVQGDSTRHVEECVSVLKSVTNYAMHIDPESREEFVALLEKCYQLAKSSLLSICYISDK